MNPALSKLMEEKQYDYDPYAVTGEDEKQTHWELGFKSGFASGVDLEAIALLEPKDLKDNPYVMKLLEAIKLSGPDDHHLYCIVHDYPARKCDCSFGLFSEALKPFNEKG